eukprot:Gb_37623 [translate_table: standard]
MLNFRYLIDKKCVHISGIFGKLLLLSAVIDIGKLDNWLPFKGSSDAELANYEEGNIGVHTMTIPVIAGVLSALRRVFARRVSLKTQWKRRLHAVTIASATCFLFPFAIWESTVCFLWYMWLQLFSDLVVIVKCLYTIYSHAIAGARLISFTHCHYRDQIQKKLQILSLRPGLI